MAEHARPLVRRRVLASTLLALLASSGCLIDSGPPPTDPGVPLALARLRERTLGDLSYRVRLVVPAERTRPVEGETVVRFRWDDAGRRDVVLDFLEPSTRIRSVESNGATVAWRPENDHVVIPAAALRDGENEVRLVYTAGDEALNRQDDFLYSLFVPDRHHYSLPVFDQPSLKATWQLTLDLPADWVAVGNGEESPADATEAQDGAPPRRVWTFAETKPIAPYLFSFVAGRFRVEVSEADGRRLRMFHRETDAARVARSRDQIFALHRSALAWMEEYTGVPYPFDKLDFVLVPAFQYGGMEHPGAILYRQDGLLLDESATQSDLLDRATTIAHETSHMWFGDLVTMRWFDDVWTKEVFANFLAAKIVGPSFPDVDHELRFLVEHYPAAYAIDRTAGTNAIHQELANLRDAGSLYGSVIYDKAPIVMRQLEGLVGEEGLREGLREYLGRYAYGNATWPELIEILDRGASVDLEGWSEAWVEEPGRPTVRVGREVGDGIGTRVAITAEDPSGEDRLWPQTLRVAYPEGDSIRFRTVDLEDRAELDLPGVQPAWILPNGGGFEYGRFVLDDASRIALLDSVGAIVPGRVRAAAWLTLWDAVLSGEIPPERFLERVLASLPSEPDEQIAQLLLADLQTTYWRFLPSVERGRRGPGVERVTWRGAREARTPTLRAAYFAAWRNLVETPEGADRMRRIWSGEEAPPVPLGEPDRTRLAAQLALLEVDGWRQILEQEDARIQNPDRKARFAFIRPALSADPADRERFFASLADVANRRHEPWVLDALYYLDHPRRAEHAERFILPALEAMEEIQRTGDIFFPASWIQTVLWGHTRPEAAETVRKFLADHPDFPPQLRLKILQAVDPVERSARIVHGWDG